MSNTAEDDEIAIVPLGKDGSKGEAQILTSDLKLLKSWGVKTKYWNVHARGQVMCSGRRLNGNRRGNNEFISHLILDAPDNVPVIHVDGDKRNLVRSNLKLNGKRHPGARGALTKNFYDPKRDIGLVGQICKQWAGPDWANQTDMDIHKERTEDLLRTFADRPDYARLKAKAKRHLVKFWRRLWSQGKLESQIFQESGALPSGPTDKTVTHLIRGQRTPPRGSGYDRGK